MQLLAVKSILPQVAASEVASILAMQVAMPRGFPAILANHLPVEATVHPGGLARDGGLGRNGAGTHDQQGRRKGKQ